MHKTSLFLFHRDLRLNDNRGLLKAVKESEKVIPCFIFEKKQLQKNDYRGNNLIQFMLNSLDELDGECKHHGAGISFYSGNTVDVLEQLIKQHKIDAIYSNRDYTPFAQKRDKQIQALCASLSCEFRQIADALLVEPELVKNGAGEPYKVYSAFARKAKEFIVEKPKRFSGKPFIKAKGSLKKSDLFSNILPKSDYNAKIKLKGGREEALKLLKRVATLQGYKEYRDIPHLEATSYLSAHNKFGTVSIREVYHRIVSNLGKGSQLLNELYWRDFFTHIAFHFPHVFGHAFHKKYDALKWNRSIKDFEKWKTGQTGFPIVDAGMRELNATGYMHNRVRMIVASFLIKDLSIDWRWGEKYFAQKLIDYDPSVNNGNWQWAASTGTDAQPYFRIFNPWLQQKKFDPDAIYIKKWIPELSEIEPKLLHQLFKAPLGLSDYPDPIVDHSVASKQTKEAYAKIA